jgi:chromatin assembly factor 1 subunit B
MILYSIMSDHSYVDGMIIIWAPSSTPQTAAFGSEMSAEELQYEKEYWRARTPFRFVISVCAPMR